MKAKRSSTVGSAHPTPGPSSPRISDCTDTAHVAMTATFGCPDVVTRTTTNHRFATQPAGALSRASYTGRRGLVDRLRPWRLRRGAFIRLARIDNAIGTDLERLLQFVRKAQNGSRLALLQETNHLSDSFIFLGHGCSPKQGARQDLTIAARATLRSVVRPLAAVKTETAPTFENSLDCARLIAAYMRCASRA